MLIGIVFLITGFYLKALKTSQCLKRIHNNEKLKASLSPRDLYPDVFLVYKSMVLDGSITGREALQATVYGIIKTY